MILLKQNWLKLLIALLILLAFYWFELREEIIEKNCNSFAMERVHSKKANLDYGDSLYRFWFRECENGRIFH